jgi:hypothetical protein
LTCTWVHAFPKSTHIDHTRINQICKAENNCTMYIYYDYYYCSTIHISTHIGTQARLILQFVYDFDIHDACHKVIKTVTNLYMEPQNSVVYQIAQLNHV